MKGDASRTYSATALESYGGAYSLNAPAVAHSCKSWFPSSHRSGVAAETSIFFALRIGLTICLYISNQVQQGEVV